MKALATIVGLILISGCAGTDRLASTSGSSGMSNTSLTSSFNQYDYPEQPDFYNR